MRTLDIVQDGRTARFIKAAQAAQQADLLPKASATTLVRLSRAVRLFLEAQEPTLAVQTLGDVESLLVGAGDEAGENLTAMVNRHVASIRSTIQAAKA